QHALRRLEPHRLARDDHRRGARGVPARVNRSRDPGADVRRAIDAYHEALVADRAAAQAQHDALRAGFERAGILYDGAPMRTLLRPHLIARSDWDALRGASRRLIELLSQVARRAFGGDVLRLCE